MGPGCVKTCTSRECAELFSLLSSPDSGCQHYWFSNRRKRDESSTRKLKFGVFTQPRPKADLPNLQKSGGFLHVTIDGQHLPRYGLSAVRSKKNRQRGDIL